MQNRDNFSLLIILPCYNMANGDLATPCLIALVTHTFHLEEK